MIAFEIPIPHWLFWIAFVLAIVIIAAAFRRLGHYEEYRRGYQTGWHMRREELEDLEDEANELRDKYIKLFTDKYPDPDYWDE